MNESVIPKWQRELRSFMGIKTGIILEGNVYDEFPIFRYEGDKFFLNGIDSIDQTIMSLVEEEKTAIIFFDPVDGFYSPSGSVDEQRKELMPLFEGYLICETSRDHDCTLCLMPNGKKNDGENVPDAKKYIWASEIIRHAVLDNTAFTDKENMVFVLNFASRLDACNLSEADSNTMFLNLMAATTLSQASQPYCNSLILVVDKYNDIPAWVYLNNPNIRTISVCVPDRNTRRVYLQNLSGKLSPFQLLSDGSYNPGKQFVAETEGFQLQELKQILQLAYRKDMKPESINQAFRLYKYGISDNPWDCLENDILAHIESKLEERVKGQDEAIRKVKTVVARAVKGLSGLQHSGTSHKPVMK